MLVRHPRSIALTTRQEHAHKTLLQMTVSYMMSERGHPNDNHQTFHLILIEHFPWIYSLRSFGIMNLQQDGALSEKRDL